MISTFEKLLAIKQSKGAGYIILLDPDKQSAVQSVKLAKLAETEGADAVFIGGSLLFFSVFDNFVNKIKKNINLPVILFPGNAQQISKYADAILFISIISGRNPDVLIGQQVLGAPIIKMLNLEAISTGYMIVESGKTSSAEFMSNTRPLPRDKNDIAVAHALAAEYFGMKLIYLEAGSGAQQPVPDEMISAIANHVSLPIIVGGGITTPEIARQKVNAGASFIVTGNTLEKNSQQGRIAEFARMIHR